MKINDNKGRREVREFPTIPTILIDESVWKMGGQNFGVSRATLVQFILKQQIFD